MQRLVKGALSMPRGLLLKDPSAVAGAAAKRAAACSAWRQLTFIPASTQLVGPGTVAGPATWLCAAGAVANHNRWWCQQRGGRSHQRCLSSASLPFGDVPVEELVKKADVAKVRAELEGLMPPPSPLLSSPLLSSPLLFSSPLFATLLLSSLAHSALPFSHPAPPHSSHCPQLDLTCLWVSRHVCPEDIDLGLLCFVCQVRHHWGGGPQPAVSLPYGG